MPHHRNMMVDSPRCPVYSKALDGDVRVFQVNTVCEQGLNIIKVLRFQLGHRGKAIVILLDQVSHEVLVEGQLVVSCDHHLVLVRETACGREQ